MAIFSQQTVYVFLPLLTPLDDNNNVIPSSKVSRMRSHNEQFLPDTLTCLCSRRGETRKCNYLKKRKLAKIACVTEDHDSHASSKKCVKVERIFLLNKAKMSGKFSNSQLFDDFFNGLNALAISHVEIYDELFV